MSGCRLNWTLAQQAAGALGKGIEAEEWDLRPNCGMRRAPSQAALKKASPHRVRTRIKGEGNSLEPLSFHNTLNRLSRHAEDKVLRES
jgi:hypothetical protein